MKKLSALTFLALMWLLPAAAAKEFIPPLVQPVSIDGPVFECANDELWGYLRKGLTYLESPTPLLPPEAVVPSYVHPDGRGFGAYGFSPEAYEDIQRLYPYFRNVSWEQLLGSQRLYDLANRALCDWMLKSQADYIPRSASKEEVFQVVHKAWNLGMGGFRKGREVVASRTRRAAEFLASNK